MALFSDYILPLSVMMASIMLIATILLSMLISGIPALLTMRENMPQHHRDAQDFKRLAALLIITFSIWVATSH